VSLHDELVSAPTCKLCAFLDSLTPSEAVEWQAELAMSVSVIGHTAVLNALRRRGTIVTEAAVRRHRSNHVG
jgi:hypothetical protein